MKVINKMSRSVYGFKYPVKGSFNLGEICPIGSVIEVYPYDEFVIDIASVIRMATPIAPIMDDLDAEITAHFVPLRLVGTPNGDYTNQGFANSINANSFEKLIGNGFGNPADWSQTNPELVTAPTATWNGNQAMSQAFTTIGEALGLGLGMGDNTAGTRNVLAYPLYGYNLIYQERFRNEDVETAKTSLAYGSNLYGASGTPTATSGNDATYNHALSVAYKHGDRFTNAKPSPQKGPAVVLPLGDKAPVIVDDSVINNNATKDYTGLKWKYAIGGPVTPTGTNGYALGVVSNADSQTGFAAASTAMSSKLAPSNLAADLSTATAATVNQFIEAYNLNQLLMRDIKGTRYYEIIKNHFSIINDDIRLYIPELLNINRFAINVSPVVQQSGAPSTGGSATDQNNMLGTTGAYSFTANNTHLVHHAFGEHGYIYFLIVIRQRNTYGQGIPKMFLRDKRFSFFWPELGRIGYQPIMKCELNADEPLATGIYGYEPAWEELRRVNMGQVFGFLNPAKNNSLDYWTLAENRNATPLLSMSFLKQDRTNLARALTIGSTGPDFIMDALVYGKKSTLVPLGDMPKLFR